MSCERSRQKGLAAVAGAAMLLICALSARADEVVPEYQLKAEFIERFTRFIDWPSSSIAGDTFVIGVIGKDPFGPYLRELASTRKIKGKRVVVRTIDDGSIESCHILFVAGSEGKRLASILARTSGRPVLTVGDSEGFGEAGVMINFFHSENRVRFEINVDTAEKSGLRVGSKLLKLAKVVGEEGR
jgi:hypothetical protein